MSHDVERAEERRGCGALVKGWAKTLKRQVATLYFAYRHPGTPWYAKALVLLVLCYALSPIDLIPDFIPVLGYLDDIILVPAGVWLSMQLIPDAVWRECVEMAADTSNRSLPRNYWTAAFIILLYLLGLFYCGKWAWAWWSTPTSGDADPTAI